MACATTESRFGATRTAERRVLDAPSAYPVPPAERTGPLWDALREVMDPEIPISLVDLGLIYDMRQDGGSVEVDLDLHGDGVPVHGLHPLRHPGPPAARAGC